MKKFIIMLMVVIMTLSFIGCDTKNSNGQDDDFDYGDSSQWAGTEYVSKDLGLMYFDAFPDGVLCTGGRSQGIGTVDEIHYPARRYLPLRGEFMNIGNDPFHFH